MEQYDIYKAGGILIRNRKLLVEKEQGKELFLAPGGKVEKDESVTQALQRELKEEFGIDTHETDFELMDTFYANAAADKDNRVLKMDVYFVHRWEGTTIPNEQGQEIRWISTSDIGKLPIGSIFEKEIIPRLVEQNLID